MSGSFDIKGWCPGALRPMLAADGYVVRLRPKDGQLSSRQGLALADLARRYGTGVLTLTSRANIQLRGIEAIDHPALLLALEVEGLLDESVRVESQRNILLSPFWQANDATQPLCVALGNAQGDTGAPLLPSKFGFVLDLGDAPYLRAASGDVRVERAHTQSPTQEPLFWVYPEGATTGWLGHQSLVVKAAMDLAHWFVRHNGFENPRGRMRVLIERALPLPDAFQTPLDLMPPAPQAPLGAVQVGLGQGGFLVGLRFGQMSADLCSYLCGFGPLHMTPWRQIYLPQATVQPTHPALLTDANDPYSRIDICTGAPACTQALGETLSLAHEVAKILPKGRFAHLSGCAKGCARASACDVTIVAQKGGFLWGRNAQAGNLFGPALSQEYLLEDLQSAFERPDHA